MERAEEIHEIININLYLLNAGGHYIGFKENMFKERNSPGFEAVGYALLMIIDPAECKSKIPWPLVNDKAQAREFRTNFTKFIKMINTRYPEAKIPEINASSLQFPGGIKFLEFIYKLSTFALELELKKALCSEERDNLLPKPFMCKAKEQKVKLMIIRGARYKEEEALLKFKQYEEDAPLMLKKMNNCLNNITTNCKSMEEQLKLEISSLDFDDQTEASLLNIEDTTAIKEYNERIEKKCEELEDNSQKLSQLHDLAIKCSQLGKSSLHTAEEPQCLDGYKLGFNRFANELAGESLVNLEGDVKLLEIIRAAHGAITRLTRSPGPSSLLLPAKDLQVRCNSLAARAYKAESALKRLSLETKQAVNTLQPVIYSNLKKKKIPRMFKHLEERPPLNLVLPQSVAERDVVGKPGRKRKSFGTIISRKNKVVCSFKTKQKPKKHVSSTPFFKTPACRKSLYNTLPSGTRHKGIGEYKPLEVTLDSQTSLSPVTLSNQESGISEPSPFNSCATNETSSPQPAPVLRCGRKSLNDIVQRYLRLKLKQSMNMSSNSKNESDLCNES